jgi:hypothetical protein
VSSVKRSVQWVAVVGALSLALSACGGNPTSSDAYVALKDELATTQQELAATTNDLEQARAALDAATAATAATGTTTAIPANVAALIDAWWAANNREDGSVVDLYLPSGYHMYGEQKITRDKLAAHFSIPGYTAESISGPFLIAAEPEGRYVVTQGIRTSSGSQSWASALTFEIQAMADGELKLAQTDFLYVHN